MRLLKYTGSKPSTDYLVEYLSFLDVASMYTDCIYCSSGYLVVVNDGVVYKCHAHLNEVSEYYLFSFDRHDDLKTYIWYRQNSSSLSDLLVRLMHDVGVALV